jgi:hypothetical protein
MAFIEIDGIDEIKAKFGKIPGAIGAAVKAVALEIKGWISPYPSARIESLYRRTMGLFHSWSVKSIGDMGAEVGNNRSYGPFVQSAEKQAAVHQGIWLTDEDAVEEWGPKATDRVKDAIEKVT